MAKAFLFFSSAWQVPVSSKISIVSAVWCYNDRIDSLAAGLLDVSHDIHAHPELNYEEHHAHAVLTDLLEAEGLRPERHAWGLDTAFDCHVGTLGAEVAVLCEYDALPGLGHACGHNLMAAGMMAAAAALREKGRSLLPVGVTGARGAFAAGDVVDATALSEHGLVKNNDNRAYPVKLLANGEITHALTVRVDQASAAAIAKIEAAGGRVELVGQE